MVNYSPYCLCAPWCKVGMGGGDYWNICAPYIENTKFHPINSVGILPEKIPLNLATSKLNT